MRGSAHTYLRDRGDRIAQTLTFQADWGAGQIWRTWDSETLVPPCFPLSLSWESRGGRCKINLHTVKLPHLPCFHRQADGPDAGSCEGLRPRQPGDCHRVSLLLASLCLSTKARLLFLYLTSPNLPGEGRSRDQRPYPGGLLNIKGSFEERARWGNAFVLD